MQSLNQSIASVVAQLNAKLKGAATPRLFFYLHAQRYYFKKLKEKNEARFDP